jgi:hypothetical protein
VIRDVGTVVDKLVRHPSLWATALRQARRLARPAWWRHRPFLPVPAPAYLRFRLLTQYGDERHRPEVGDVLNYLRWCKQWDAR